LLARFLAVADGERFVTAERAIAAHLGTLFPGDVRHLANVRRSRSDFGAGCGWNGPVTHEERPPYPLSRVGSHPVQQPIPIQLG
jgi:hypothetical protein